MTDNEVNAVGLKLPAFWTLQPHVWFVQAEAQFHLRNITQDTTKYYYVISSLDQSTASRMLDVISHPPQDNKYEDLKQKLLSTFSLSSRDRANRLLHFRAAGDSRPSEIMDEILSLLDGHKPCMLAEQIFLEQLPEDIRLQISEEDFKDPRAVALRADILWAAKQQSPMQTINKITTNKKDQKQKETQPGWCYFHNRFGDKARKCQPPCTHTGNALAGRQ
jgi:hypothetical protein